MAAPGAARAGQPARANSLPARVERASQSHRQGNVVRDARRCSTRSGARLELSPALDGAGRHRRYRKRLWRQHCDLLGRRHRLRPVSALYLGDTGIGNGGNPYDYHDALPAMARYLCRRVPARTCAALSAYNHADWYVNEVLEKADRYGGLGASGGGLVGGWSNAPALNQYDERNYVSAAMWQQWDAAACSAAALDWLLRAYGVRLGGIDQAIALIGPNTGISPAWAAGRYRPTLARATGQWAQPAQRAGTFDRRIRGWLDPGPLHWTARAGSARATGSWRPATTRTASTSATPAAGTRAISPGRACTARSALAAGWSASRAADSASTSRPCRAETWRYASFLVHAR